MIALADMLCEGAAADWSAVYLRSSLNASGVILGLAYTLYSLVMVTTRFAGTRLLARWPRHHVLPSLTALATVGFAVGLAAHDTAITLMAFCCLGAGCALVIPTTYSTVGETTSANPGRAVALVSGIGWVGFVAGPPLIGQIASATSLRFALIDHPGAHRSHHRLDDCDRSLHGRIGAGYPASGGVSSARSVRRPSRIRVLAVPTEMPSDAAISWAV